MSSWHYIFTQEIIHIYWIITRIVTLRDREVKKEKGCPQTAYNLVGRVRLMYKITVASLKDSVKDVVVLRNSWKGDPEGSE